MTMVTAWPDDLFAPHVGRRAPAVLRTSDGRSEHLAVRRWHDRPGAADRSVLARVGETVLDIGCGPGRHVRALARAGHRALGVDSSAAAVALARRRGAIAVQASVFGPVPGAGEWGTVLLLDGNIGIGGDPTALLRRAHELLQAGGRVLVELAPPGSSGGRVRVRVEHAGRAGHWFPWARLTPGQLDRVATASRFRVEETWAVSGRWFAHLVRLGGPA
jgi:SAM-dependent methyltransferase